MSRQIKRTRALWARLSVGYYRDAKVLEAGPLAELAFIRLLSLAREVVESAEVDGAVPLALARRELRDIAELAAQLDGSSPDVDALLDQLVEVGLATRTKRSIILGGYQAWQTTRGEIESARERTRERTAAWRARQAGEDPESDNEDDGTADDADSTTSGGKRRMAKTAQRTTTPSGREDDEMGLYDNSVEAFADLRETGSVKRGTRTVGKNGLNPKLVPDAERIVAHFSEVRQEVLGSSSRPTATWWGDAGRLLTGAGDVPALTADQVCDLTDFALHHKFWHAHCATPGGLAKHAGKLYASDEYVAWSKRNKRPVENRPRDTLIGSSGPASFRGELAADKSVDWSKVGDTL